jgi:hypothetical protein
MRRVALAAALFACDGGSKLDAPMPSGLSARVLSVESSGGQSPKVVGLYMDRIADRVRIACRPEPGTTAEIVLTVDRTGRVAEVGIRTAATALVPCARRELANQRFPRVKTATLIGAHVEL